MGGPAPLGMSPVLSNTKALVLVGAIKRTGNDGLCDKQVDKDVPQFALPLG